MVVYDKEKIARMLSKGKFPVVTINRENNPYAVMRPDSDYAMGCKVRLMVDESDGRLELCSLCYGDGKYSLNAEGSYVCGEFGYADVMAMAAAANYPVVKPGQEVVLVEFWPTKRQFNIVWMKVSENIRPNCIGIAYLREVTKEETYFRII